MKAFTVINLLDKSIVCNVGAATAYEACVIASALRGIPQSLLGVR